MAIKMRNPNPGGFPGAILEPVKSMDEAFNIEGFQGLWQVPGSNEFPIRSFKDGGQILFIPPANQPPEFGVQEGKPVLVFDGSDDLAINGQGGGTITGATEITLGIRGYFDTSIQPGGQCRLWDTNGVQMYGALDSAKANAIFLTNGTTGGYVIAPWTNQNRWATLIFTASGTTGRIDINGEVTTQTVPAMNLATAQGIGPGTFTGNQTGFKLQKMFLAWSDMFGTVDYDDLKTFLG